LKNTGLTEKQISSASIWGMTDAQADREATVREVTRNHSGTGFHAACAGADRASPFEQTSERMGE